MNPIKVIIIDDHELFRAGIISLFESEDSVEIIGEASDRDQGFALLKKETADLVLLDISFPNESGIDFCEEILKTYPEIRIIILTMHASNEYLKASFEAGAVGYALKDAAVDELTSAIKSVHAGNQFVSFSLLKGVMKSYIKYDNKSRPSKNTNDQLAALSLREIEVLTLAGAGNSNDQISAHLNISAATVKKHRSNLMKKLNLHKSTDIVILAHRANLVN